MKSVNKVILPLFFLVLFLSIHFNDGISEAKKTISSAQDSCVTIRLSVVGDIMCHTPQLAYAKTDNDKYDFDPVFREVNKYFSKADFLLGNFETVTGGSDKEYTGYPFFNTPDDFVASLKHSGFNILSTANNHALDQGEKGALRTIEIIKKNRINYNGTFNSQRDRDSIRIFNIKGIKTAYLAYSYGTNGNPIPKEKPYLINIIDSGLIKKDIAAARKNGAELVIVHFHFGEEYKREPVLSQRKAVECAVNCGADIIIGGHPHVIEPIDYYKTVNGKLATGFVVYSMGNFISNQQWRYSDVGMILSIEVTKNIRNDSLFISKVDYTPTWVFKGSIKGKNEYVILPVSSPDDCAKYPFLSSDERARMNQALEDTKEIVTKYNSNISLAGSLK